MATVEVRGLKHWDTFFELFKVSIPTAMLFVFLSLRRRHPLQYLFLFFEIENSYRVFLFRSRVVVYF